MKPATDTPNDPLEPPAETERTERIRKEMMAEWHGLANDIHDRFGDWVRGQVPFLHLLERMRMVHVKAEMKPVLGTPHLWTMNHVFEGQKQPVTGFAIYLEFRSEDLLVKRFLDMEFEERLKPQTGE